LKGFKGKTPEEVCAAINAVDETIFEETSTIKTLLKVWEDAKEEIVQVEEHIAEKGTDNLGPPELFVHALKGVSNLQLKLNSFLSKMELPVKLEEVGPQIQHVIKASEQMVASKKFINLMEVILLMGNFLNSGTAKGNVAGFNYESLNKTVDTKTGDNKRTLLHIIQEYSEEHLKEEVEGWQDELDSVPLAAKVAGAQFESDIKGLEKMYNDIDNALKKIPEDGSQFHPVMKKFLEQIRTKLDDLNSSFTKMKEVYDKARAYVALDVKKALAPEEFFATLSTFMSHWKRVTDDNIKIRLQKEKEAKKAEAKKSVKKTKTAVNVLPGEDKLIAGLKKNAMGGGAFIGARKATSGKKKTVKLARAMDV